MTIDPDDYDLRELRRIANERRSDRRTDDPDDADGSRSQSGDRRRRRQSNGHESLDRPDRSEPRRRNGDRRNGDRRNGRRRSERTERGRDDRRENGTADRQRNGRTDRETRGDDEVSVRPREGVTPPRRGESDHADGHDEVVRADRIAQDFGFGREGEPRERRRDSGRRARGRADGLSRPRTGGTGFEHPDDVGRFQFDTEIRERPRGRAGEALRQNQLEQLLVHETAAADRLSKPYLSSVPDAYAAERIVFEWLEFLVLKGGYKRTMDALRYYHTVEWITADVEAELQDYLVGFSGEVTDTTEFDVDDHHLSLVYIARLASME